MSFLAVKAVSKHYGSVAALDGVSLDIHAGSRTAIVGPSGSGKTTLLRLIAGFDAPDVGQITLDGLLLADGPAAVPAYRRDIGVVMQDGALFPHLSVADNIGFGLPRRAADRRATIIGLIDMVGLDRAMLSRRPDALSGGQQQRVALARALARRPKLMLLDEPFSALDTGLRAGTRKMVADLLYSAGITTVLVTHDQAEALSFADQVVVMGAGRLLQAGAPRDLYLRPRTPMIASFLGDAIILPAVLADGVASCVLGRVAVNDRHCRGEGTIMLRPEQVSLTENGRSPDATVIEVEFSGASCNVTLRLTGNATVTLPQPGFGLHTPGVGVEITIAGCAHVFGSIE